MRQSVVFKLRGTLDAAVAVEWTDAVSPADSANGWQACLRLPNGDWCFTSHAPEAGSERRGPGLFPDIALRYRLSPSGPWTLISASRKEITLVAVEASDPRRKSLEIPAAALIPPLLLLTPALAGTGKIGSEVVVTPGVWGGVPAPELALQWCRDGAAIPGATGPVYRAGPRGRPRPAHLPRQRREPRRHRPGRDRRARDHPRGPRGGGGDLRGDLRPALGRADR